VTIPGQDVPGDILSYARQGNFSHVVIGNPGRWRLLRPSVAQRVVARSGDIPVHVVGGSDGDSEKAKPPPAARPHLRPEPYAISAAMVAGGIGAGMALRPFVAPSSISLVFLTVVLGAASVFGLGPSLLACGLSVLAYNFFFLPPLYTFTIADPENVVALFFFLVAALIAGNLASRVRAQAVLARTRARTTEELYQFSRKLAGVVAIDDLLWATAYQIASMLKMHVMLLLPEGERIEVRAGYPPEDLLDDADLAAATWCWKHDRPAGRGADTLPGARRLFLPLRTGRGAVGVIGLDAEREGPLLPPDDRRLLDALTGQAAIAIERITLADEIDRTRLLAETEKLRSALLTSLSHDLRTPLAAILGAASSLDAYGHALGDEGRSELLRTVIEESERLNRFVANLLDMTRLEAGALRLRLEPADLSEVVGAALARASRVLSGHRVVTEIPPDLPLPLLDVVLFEQVLFNVLDNAA
jgi:two-component system sensor histidine kinase KdpD